MNLYVLIQTQDEDIETVNIFGTFQEALEESSLLFKYYMETRYELETPVVFSEDLSEVTVLSDDATEWCYDVNIEKEWVNIYDDADYKYNIYVYSFHDPYSDDKAKILELLSQKEHELINQYKDILNLQDISLLEEFRLKYINIAFFKENLKGFFNLETRNIFFNYLYNKITAFPYTQENHIYREFMKLSERERFILVFDAMKKNLDVSIQYVTQYLNKKYGEYKR